jgi:hypothetical protein
LKMPWISGLNSTRIWCIYAIQQDLNSNTKFGLNSGLKFRTFSTRGVTGRWKCLHFNVVWSKIPFEFKKINSFFDLYGNLINPHISFNMIRANLLRIWGWNFYGRLLRHQVVDFTLRSSNPTSFARPNLHSVPK